MAAVRSKKRPAAAADRLINRELSFLDYAARVLALGRDPALPLLERVKFCSIVSEMLDEFFMVRIAGLNGQAAAGIVVRSADGRTAPQTLREARTRVLELQAAPRGDSGPRRRSNQQSGRTKARPREGRI